MNARLNAKCAALSIEATRRWAYVSIRRQRLLVFDGGSLASGFICSTSAKPPSNRDGSHGTPPGLHCVAEKFGDCAPAGMVFVGRRATGSLYPELDTMAEPPNRITTRILWLRGLEPGLNAGAGCDSHARYIYIHGTNCEAGLGTPMSAGCVLLSNADVITVYEALPPGALVWIDD